MWDTERIENGHAADTGGLNIRAPWGEDDRCRLIIPEFSGTTISATFRIDQTLVWSQDTESPSTVNFALAGEPADLGTDFRGHVTLAEPDQIDLSLSLTNCFDTELKSGRHLLFLDLCGLRGFADPSGESTFYYTDTGWRSRADLFRAADIQNASQPVRIGSRLGKSTVIWDIIVRTDSHRKRMVAFSLNRAMAFTGDHPDWGCGLLAACRWGPLAPGERHHAMGIVYLTTADLYALEDRYLQNRKRR
jgi:hypothetical protein